MTRSLKVSDEVTAEFFRIIEWSKSFSLLNSVHYDVWNELEQLVYKKQERVILFVVTTHTAIKVRKFVACCITR
jgi:hypothetical protein